MGIRGYKNIYMYYVLLKNWYLITLKNVVKKQSYFGCQTKTIYTKLFLETLCQEIYWKLCAQEMLFCI